MPSFLLCCGLSGAPIPVKKKKGRLIIPFVTGYSTRGPLASNGKKLLSGSKLYLRQKKNKKKSLVHKGNIGRFNHKISKKIRRFAKKTPLFLGVYGSRPLLSVLTSRKKENSFLFCPVEGSSSIRKKHRDNIVYFRPTHRNELNALVEYVVKHCMRSKIAVFHEASMWGDSVVSDLKKALTKYDIQLLSEASYSEGTINVANAVSIIADSNPNVVFCIASSRAAYNFIRRALNQGLHKSLFVGLSNLHVIQGLLKSSRGMDIAVTSVLPNPETSDLPIAKEYRNNSRELLKGVPLSAASFEGYINTAILMKCLGDVQGVLSAEKLLAVAKKFQNTDLGGLKLTYFHDINALSKGIWINPGVGRKWKVFKAKQDSA